VGVVHTHKNCINWVCCNADCSTLYGSAHLYTSCVHAHFLQDWLMLPLLLSAALVACMVGVVLITAAAAAAPPLLLLLKASASTHGYG
jgi:hypothetical protein